MIEEITWRTKCSTVENDTKKLNLNDKWGKVCGEIVKIYGKNKQNRSIDNIREEQNILGE